MLASAFFLSSGRPGTTWMNDDRTDSRTPTHTRTYHTWTPAKKMRGRRLPPVSPNKWFLTPQRPRKHQLEPTGGRRLPLIFSMGSVRSACACVCVCLCIWAGVSCGVTIWVSLVWCTVIIHSRDFWPSARSKRMADTNTGSVLQIGIFWNRSF